MRLEDDVLNFDFRLLILQKLHLRLFPYLLDFKLLPNFATYNWSNIKSIP